MNFLKKITPKIVQPAGVILFLMIGFVFLHWILWNLYWLVPPTGILITEKVLNWVHFILCLLFLPILFLSKPGFKTGLVLFVIYLLISCFGSIWFLSVTEILDSITYKNNQYVYILDYLITDPTAETCFLSKCDLNGLNCETIDFSRNHCNDDIRVVLHANNENDEITVFKYYYSDDRVSLYYTYGDKQRKYIDSLFYEGFDYSLGYYYAEEIQNARYTLYRCETGTMTCEQLPFLYTRDYGMYSGKLKIDEISGEIQMWDGPDLIYTYGETTTCYVENCTTLP